MVLLTLLGVRNELLVTNVTSCVPLDPGIGWSAVCAYGVFVLVVFVLGVRMVYNDKRLSVPVVFLLIMLCFASLRVSYFVLKILPEYCLRSAASFALNRMCFCFYFTALTLVLFYWAEQAHR
jgi:putative flippase GtrA